jgi:hypothetical protein
MDSKQRWRRSFRHGDSGITMTFQEYEVVQLAVDMPIQALPQDLWA